MPYILQSGKVTNPLVSATANYRYRYPAGLSLRPGSQLHDDIVSKLVGEYANNSATIISKRHADWRKMDDTLQGYIWLSDDEKEVVSKDPRKPVSIVFPYTYAILETLLSYMVTAFFPEPMFRYEGHGPEDVAGAYLLQGLINLHTVRNKVALNLHTFFRDIHAYGMGVVSPQWREDRGIVYDSAPTGALDHLGNFQFGGMSEPIAEEGVIFEGNILENIDPYRYLPDPSVSIHDVQKGVFVGWLSSTNYMDALSEEQYSDGEIFNTKYLRHVQHHRSTIFSSGASTHSAENRYYNYIAPGHTTSDNLEQVDKLHIYVKLIPEEWGLGKGEYPEKWLFTVGNDAILLQAKKLDLAHGMYPVCVAAPDFDGYSPVAFSRLEIVAGMQKIINWFFNSHVTNVRKAINDMLVVDPYLVNMRDLEDPEPGKLIKLRRPAWGRGIENAVKQLGITDITARNMQDVALIIQYMQQATGTDDTTMGNLRQGGPERLTSAEYRGTAQGAISRLSRMAKIIGVQGMQDIGYQFAYNAQQLMSQETYIKAMGSWPEHIARTLSVRDQRALVTPRSIKIAYDLLVRDGSIPGGNFSDQWIQLYKIIAENPELARKFDLFRYFEHIAINLGAKNIDDFRAQPQMQPQVAFETMPDEQVAAAVQAGRAVPALGEMNGITG